VNSFKRYRDVGVVIILLAVPFFFLRANMKDPTKLNALDRALLRISAPVEFAASSLARGVSNVIESYTYLVGVKEENDRLKYELARANERIHKLEQNEADNRDLRRLLQLRESLPGDMVSAQVVGKDFNEFFRVTRVVLDRGSRNVRPHMAVASPDGVVGTVMRVAGDAVDVQLAVDAAFTVDVEDERTHARGFVRGTGDPSRYACKVENVDSRDEVELNDLLVTSGKGKWFPKGLPVARVTKVVKREPGRDQEIEAVPTVNFSRLDAVLILVTPPSDDDAAPPPTGKTASAKSGGSK
jgi:rod shape-determining protein MreC